VLGLLAFIATLIVVLSKVITPPDDPAPALASTPLKTGVVIGSPERNSIYSAAALTGACPAPRADAPDTRLRFLNALTDCMDRSWPQPFEANGLPYRPPSRVFWTTPGRGPCGDYPGDAAAYYCPANEGIYLGVEEGEPSIVVAALLAHEYGHHVQEIAGIADATWQQANATSDKSVIATISRRAELQADCFAGVWFTAVHDSLPVTADNWKIVLEDFSNRGDSGAERTHGTGEHTAAWLNGGFLGGRPGHCNTWTAPAADVA
jgi:predicted metalloprotease